MTGATLRQFPRRFFWVVTSRPKAILALACLLLAVPALWLPELKKDTRGDAFLRSDHPAVLFRDTVEEVFGLRDPMVLAVVAEGEHGVFTPETLSLVAWLTEEVRQVHGIDPERVTSLASEKNIYGSGDDMLVEPFFEEPPQSQAEAEAIRAAVMDFPLYLGSLVARDGRATLIVAELLDEDDAQAIHDRLMAVAAAAPISEGVEIHVAGQGALMGYIGSYIDTDAARLTPIAGIIITIMLFLAYRTLRGVVLPLLVALGTLSVSLGTMAACGLPFYPITNALPVILIGIAVADSIHILGQYYEELARRPRASQRQLVIRAMEAMWRPVTVTSVTTIAGFFGIFLASALMPPMKWFGLFAILGIATALVLSLVAIPAGLTLLKPRPSPAFRPGQGKEPGGAQDLVARLIVGLGVQVARRPGVILTLSLALAVAATAGALRLEANEDDIENFHDDEPIYQAHQAINRLTDGTNYLDIVVETPAPDGLLEPANLRRIEDLQAFLERLPHVKGTTSIADYLKQMNRAVHEHDPAAYRLPDDADLVAQYLLLYSVTGDPTDLEDVIDYEYRLGNIRAFLDTGLYSDQSVVVAAAERYITERIDGPGLAARLSGRVAVFTQWMEELVQSHAISLVLSLSLVWLTAIASFRSVFAGTLVVIPVGLSVLLIYGVMGAGGIWLAIGTSMSAAIAIGIGVDFAVHTLERLIVESRAGASTFEAVVARALPATGRALFFNFATVLLGFGVLVTSQVPGLTRFGCLVAVAVAASFVTSMTLLPALVGLLRPGFLGRTRDRSYAALSRPGLGAGAK